MISSRNGSRPSFLVYERGWERPRSTRDRDGVRPPDETRSTCTAEGRGFHSVDSRSVDVSTCGHEQLGLRSKDLLLYTNEWINTSLSSLNVYTKYISKSRGNLDGSGLTPEVQFLGIDLFRLTGIWSSWLKIGMLMTSLNFYVNLSFVNVLVSRILVNETRPQHLKFIIITLGSYRLYYIKFNIVKGSSNYKIRIENGNFQTF